MKIEVVDKEGEVIEEEQNISPSETTPVLEGEMMLQQVGALFDLKPTECQKYANKLNLLIDYAKTQTDDHTIIGMKWAIRSLQGKVGTPPLGQKWLPYLCEYAHLKLEAITRQEDIDKFERNT